MEVFLCAGFILGVGKWYSVARCHKKIYVCVYHIIHNEWNLQGLGAVVGAVSRNLADLQERQGSYLSIYDQPALTLQVFLTYPFM